MSSRHSVPSVDRYRLPAREEQVSPAPAMSRQSRYLHPGQILVAKQPTAVTTILGSCVSVCLFDSTRQIGGINHFMLPNWVGRGRASSRFGNIAVANLVEGMVFEGSTVRDLRAKLFGGSHLFSSGDAADTESLLGGALGLRNVDVAREELGSLGIQVIAEDIGGTHGRKLIFYTDDGSIKIKQLRRSDQGQDA